LKPIDPKIVEACSLKAADASTRLAALATLLENYMSMEDEDGNRGFRAPNENLCFPETNHGLGRILRDIAGDLMRVRYQLSGIPEHEGGLKPDYADEATPAPVRVVRKPPGDGLDG
jgi:hypothetical protein